MFVWSTALCRPCNSLRGRQLDGGVEGHLPTDAILQCQPPPSPLKKLTRRYFFTASSRLRGVHTAANEPNKHRSQRSIDARNTCPSPVITTPIPGQPPTPHRVSLRRHATPLLPPTPTFRNRASNKGNHHSLPAEPNGTFATTPRVQGLRVCTTASVRAMAEVPDRVRAAASHRNSIFPE